jgi:hypothetical protein
MNLGRDETLSYAGRRFGYKNLQFRHYLDLPRHVPAATLEVALGDFDYLEWKAEEAGSDRPSVPGLTARNVLEDAGWRVVRAAKACPDLESYRAYIEQSLGEWSVAKHGYVVGQPGWFSCRSACYLAAGKPVVIENTGFDRVLPVGEGILAFRTVEEAAAAIKEVTANYARHAAAARDIAVTYFDSAKVLTSLIERAMNSPAGVFPRVSAAEHRPRGTPPTSIAFEVH